jgi:hypothetical protein
MSDRQAELDRGIKAERLLNDPTLTEAFDLVSKAIHERWEQCPTRDREGAHELKLMLKLLGDVRANLEQALVDGKLAAEELKYQARRDLSPAEFKAAYR